MRNHRTSIWSITVWLTKMSELFVSENTFGLLDTTNVAFNLECQVLTSRACRRKVLFSVLAHSMHSKHNSTSWPVAASMSKNRSSRERTSRAAFALLMEIRNGRTYFSRPPNSMWSRNVGEIVIIFEAKENSQYTSDLEPNLLRGVMRDLTSWRALPAACPVLANSLPSSKMLCSLTRTASSSSSWTSRLTVEWRRQIWLINILYSRTGHYPWFNYR